MNKDTVKRHECQVVNIEKKYTNNYT